MGLPLIVRTAISPLSTGAIVYHTLGVFGIGAPSRSEARPGKTARTWMRTRAGVEAPEVVLELARDEAAEAP